MRFISNPDPRGGHRDRADCNDGVTGRSRALADRFETADRSNRADRADRAEAIAA